MVKALIRKKPEQSLPSIFDMGWPFRDMWESMNRLEQHMADYFGDMRPAMGRETFGAPSIDLYKEKENYVVEVAVPGLKKEDVTLNVTDDSLSISGEFKDERKIDEKDMYWREIKRGSFQRTISFQESVKTEGVKASYKEGILKIILPIEQPKKGKQIKIE